MLPKIKKGDYVLIQLGHNDKESTHEEFESNMSKIIEICLQKETIPILISPPVRRLFDENKKLTPYAQHVNNIGVNLVEIINQLSKKYKINYINLTSESKKLIESLGEIDSKKRYLPAKDYNLAEDDNTHFSLFGALSIADIVMTKLKDLNLLNEYIK
jgi:lysophospholipase L1-like esterase